MAVALAYSYLRFSSDAQEDGDSIRRQESLRDAWLKRHPEVKLAAKTYADRGVSGYSGKHGRKATSPGSWTSSPRDAFQSAPS